MIFDVFNLLNYYHNHILITAPNLHPQELTSWKRPWCWERLKAGGEGDNRGWDGWMASLTWWAWLWASSGSWWWTGKSGVLQSMESQSQTWLRNWTELIELSPTWHEFSMTFYAFIAIKLLPWSPFLHCPKSPSCSISSSHHWLLETNYLLLINIVVVFLVLYNDL